MLASIMYLSPIAGDLGGVANTPNSTLYLTEPEADATGLVNLGGALPTLNLG